MPISINFYLLVFVSVGLDCIILSTIPCVILVVICIVFPIVGGIKANGGIEWQYPLSIRFFK
jgi:uncharacterized Tic20 family protein